MRILRSQYMQLQKKTAAANNNDNNATDYGGKKNAEETTGPHNNNNEVTTKEISISHRRQTIDCAQNVSCISSMATNIHIQFDHIEQPLRKLNVIVEFTSMSSLWLTKVYKSYENDLWRRSKRFLGNNSKNTRWYYHCGLCKNIYRQFNSMKSHLNLHLNYFPYICKVCGSKYTNRNSATWHLKKCHNILTEQWNEYLIS